MSVSLYVGRDLTEDGCVFLAGYGDEPSSHYFYLAEREENHPEAKMEVGVNSEAMFPGERIQIPRPEQTKRYITSRYSAWKGLPPPLENGGLNEDGVAAAAVWSPSRPELRKMTPEPQRGVNFSDISKIVMQKAESARQAVEIAGGLIEEFGYATYGGNSHMFADEEEGWIMIELAGGKGLWAARRLAEDEVRVSRPGYLGRIPPDYQSRPDYIGSDNLFSFAIEQGWYDPDSENEFNFGRVYQTDQRPEKPGKQIRSAGVVRMENLLQERAPGIGLIDMIGAVRSPLITSVTSGYGKVACMADLEHDFLATIWMGSGPTLTSPFIPFPLGIQEIPIEYKKHRYLTRGESTRFIDPDFQGRESTPYAFRTFKRLYHLVAEHPKEFRAEVVDTLQAFEERAIMQLNDVKNMIRGLCTEKHFEQAKRPLTELNHKLAREGLEAAETLADSIEIKTRLLYGISEPGEKGRDDRLHATIDEEFYPWAEEEFRERSESND